jgi:hypothetical protein
VEASPRRRREYFLVSRGNDRQNLHPFPLSRPCDNDRSAYGGHETHRLNETQAQQPVYKARSVVVNPEPLLVSRNWPERLKRSTSRNTSDQLSPDKLSINSSKVQSG